MSAPEFMDQVHPTDETLAAFLDDRLDKHQRRTVIEHLADCGECRTFVNDISEIKAMDEADNVVEMPKRGGWRVAVASLAVAAGLVVVFRTEIREWAVGATVDDLTTIAATAEKRPTEARLSIDVPYQKPKGVNRGEQEEQIVVEGVPPEVYRALVSLHAAKRPDPHALGIAYLIATKYEEAIPYLREAAKTNEEAKIDLAAALLAHGRDAELTEALELSQGNNPKALWNRAVALGRLNRYDKAIAAWEAYLRVDPHSEWAREAKLELEDLKDLAGLSQLQPASR
jgi:tetratricopeptide (TPR) repeat protein